MNKDMLNSKHYTT